MTISPTWAVRSEIYKLSDCYYEDQLCPMCRKGRLQRKTLDEGMYPGLNAEILLGCNRCPFCKTGREVNIKNESSEPFQPRRGVLR